MRKIFSRSLYTHIGTNRRKCYSFFIDSPEDDQLNAAQSGAIAMNLEHELDYLIPRKYIWKIAVKDRIIDCIEQK